VIGSSLLVMALGLPPGSASGAELSGDEQFTPIVMHIMSTPRWFTGTDDQVHLVYELELTNAFPSPVTVTAVAARDVGTGRTIARLSADALAASMSLVTSGAESQTELAPSTIGVVWFDIPFVATADLPTRVEHELTVLVPPGLPVPSEITDVGGRGRVDDAPPIVLHPPLEGPRWLAVGGCCDGPHRRSVQPINGELWLSQRFAIDFNRLSEDDLLATGDQGLNDSWPTYDQPILAVSDATVVQAADEFDDQIPNAPEPVTIEEADGNYVILKIRRGVYAFYAHLKPGSVAVQAGDEVRAGDVIGRTGNSGSSTGPHLHFHVMDRPSALRSN
jgi:Peptidase family M23